MRWTSELPGATVEYLKLPKIKIKLPKIQIGKAIGKAVSTLGGPVGAAAVTAANTAIKVVKGAKIQPKQILAGAAQGAIDATQARIDEGANQVAKAELGGALSKNIVPILLGGVVLLLLFRGKK